MLFDLQRILTFSGDTLEEASIQLREAIDALPLDSRIVDVTTSVEGGRVHGMAVVDLIPEADVAPPAAVQPAAVAEPSTVDDVVDGI
ncbi:hypothetical protein GCM10009846_10060 [Agrococcus versicolor]|uniref:Uncharacterized protein n=1 Tax=Agrococcus versicolor TaxID=501482 RepID=A0ABP5MD50_9MICO